MALNNARADLVANAIASALGVVDPASIAKYKQVYEILYAALKVDVVVAMGIPVSTTGTAAAQTGATTAPGTVL